MRFRTFDRTGDLERLQRLLDEISEADGHAAIGEHKYLALFDTGAADVSLVGEEEPGRFNTFVAIAAHPDGTYGMELAFHPLHRHPGLLRRTIDVGVGRVAEAGGDRVRVWAVAPNIVRALLEAGFRQERELRQLRRPLAGVSPPPGRDGIDLGRFRPGIDNHVWLDLNNRAFAGHPENGAWTADILENRLDQPWFDPGDFLVAWWGDRMVAYCWTKPHGEKLSEIYIVAVEPELIRQGLGRWITESALAHMARRGFGEAMLYVDADNRAGLALYGHLGFHLDHVDRAFLKTI